MAPLDADRVVTASREILAPADQIFGLIADPALQPSWDGNDNLDVAAAGQRVRSCGSVFVMRLTNGQDRENHVVEFEEGRRIAWRPSEMGKTPPGHLWRWELEPLDEGTTRVRHTYDWTELVDETRFVRAQATSSQDLAASIERLASRVERSDTQR
ncbi:SRPBCC family protein [Ornithinimicrobium faecis]|uniref:SRPBCC family protein n=1 Tax=Ornithinimicrobium faecis TaxID=2934158 RepID=UPI002117427A|nr:SRPBCC family protein [Ornithinimicrobium sp. HY1745]